MRSQCTLTRPSVRWLTLRFRIGRHHANFLDRSGTDAGCWVERRTLGKVQRFSFGETGVETVNE